MECKSQLSVYLYVPNIIGYFRIAANAIACLLVFNRPLYTVYLMAFSAILDFFDGYIARLLNQTSKFGVILDVFCDNLWRTTCWVIASSTHQLILPFAVLCIATEWSTFLSTQFVQQMKQSEHWKVRPKTDPVFISYAFRNNFKNPIGFTCIFGLFFCPSLICLRELAPVAWEIPGYDFFLAFACFGRFLSLLIEWYFIFEYISQFDKQ